MKGPLLCIARLRRDRHPSQEKAPALLKLATIRHFMPVRLSLQTVSAEGILTCLGHVFVRDHNYKIFCSFMATGVSLHICVHTFIFMKASGKERLHVGLTLGHRALDLTRLILLSIDITCTE